MRRVTSTAIPGGKLATPSVPGVARRERRRPISCPLGELYWWRTKGLEPSTFALRKGRRLGREWRHETTGRAKGRQCAGLWRGSGVGGVRWRVVSRLFLAANWQSCARWRVGHVRPSGRGGVVQLPQRGSQEGPNPHRGNGPAARWRWRVSPGRAPLCASRATTAIANRPGRLGHKASAQGGLAIFEEAEARSPKGP